MKISKLYQQTQNLLNLMKVSFREIIINEAIFNINV